jgi:aspartyl protease family protein
MSAGSNIVVVGLGLIGIALVAPSLPADNAVAPVAPVAGEKPAQAPAAAQAGNGAASRALERAPDGHFYAEAQVNGARVTFLVDTGASIVALTPTDAQRAGIALPSQRATARGVGGEIEVIPVTIDRLAIGPLEARGVSAAIARELPVSLLGQSFLSQVGTVEISGDRMVLR